MRTKMLLLIMGLGIFGCSSAQMVIDKDLVSISDQYEISERPGAFSGEKLTFGPYSATEIDRSFVTSSGSGIGSISSNTKVQRFTYNFKGTKDWAGKCKVEGEGISIGSSVTAGEKKEIFCIFSPGEENRGSEVRGWNFEFKGQDLISAKGFFKVGSKTVSLVGTNKFEGSSLPYGKPTGFYFYVENKVVAGVDVINSKGPVWIDKNLSAEVKDAIGAVMVALLLNQL